MSGRGHWRIVGYDGAGAPIRARFGPRVDPERREREFEHHRDGLARMQLRDEQREQDREVRLTLALNVH